jgi:arsenate reductase (thioredoxin)
MTGRPYHVLFLCTGNSARSIMAEAILNKIGGDKFRACSGGSHPKGQLHPQALRLLRRLGYETVRLRSKSWVEFLHEPQFDFVFTVCDKAAAEACPIWPGQPMIAHWGISDPAEAEGPPEEVALAFEEAHRRLSQRIEAFVALPLASLDQFTVESRLGEIGKMSGE